MTTDLLLRSDQVRLPIVEIELPWLADLFGYSLGVLDASYLRENHADPPLGERLNLSIGLKDRLQALTDDCHCRTASAWRDLLLSGSQPVGEFERRNRGGGGAGGVVASFGGAIIAKQYNYAGDQHKKQN
jgi:hypothetical protein